MRKSENQKIRKSLTILSLLVIGQVGNSTVKTVKILELLLFHRDPNVVSQHHVDASEVQKRHAVKIVGNQTLQRFLQTARFIETEMNALRNERIEVVLENLYGHLDSAPRPQGGISPENIADALKSIKIDGLKVKIQKEFFEIKNLLDFYTFYLKIKNLDENQLPKNYREILSDSKRFFLQEHESFMPAAETVIINNVTFYTENARILDAVEN